VKQINPQPFHSFATLVASGVLALGAEAAGLPHGPHGLNTMLANAWDAVAARNVDMETEK